MQGAAIKLYKGLACPLDAFELLLCSLSGPDGMTYPLCPFCYNNPPFEGIQKVTDWFIVLTLFACCVLITLCYIPNPKTICFATMSPIERILKGKLFCCIGAALPLHP